ncbi:hypothetical protein E2C01_026918 [Portunus trituberculatus]|uniref:Uncharacterized protein n=1 Tax=Portunus trituberculatus TaxID=210409 RepID=A0A5B7EKJ2_PORTR|nr:hypothetical protein [Portunus trituberculatus]
MAEIAFFFCLLHEGGGGVVDKVVSMGSLRRPRVRSNPTTYHFEATPFVEWFESHTLPPGYQCHQVVMSGLSTITHDTVK